MKPFQMFESELESAVKAAEHLRANYGPLAMLVAVLFVGERIVDCLEDMECEVRHQGGRR